MTSAPKFKNIRNICQPLTSFLPLLTLAFSREIQRWSREGYIESNRGWNWSCRCHSCLSGFPHAQAGGIPPVILAQRMLGWKDQEFKPSLNYIRPPPKKKLKIKVFCFLFNEEKEGEKKWLEHWIQQSPLHVPTAPISSSWISAQEVGAAERPISGAPASLLLLSSWLLSKIWVHF